MKRIIAVLLLNILLAAQAADLEDLSDVKALKALDASWERSQLELDLEHLQSLLADDFIWVHNHAGTVDNKKAVLNRVQKQISKHSNNTRSRVNTNVEVLLLGDTGVVHGFTTVDRGQTPTRYHFMRTYVKSNGTYYLLANHTMAIPAED